MTLLALTQHGGARVAEVGFLLVAIAGGLLFLGAVTPFGRKAGNLLGGVALAAGGILAIIATHWGHFG
ncbi:MAG TPA: hypothetical protein VFL66_08995 [Gaiellaceae bacterium]|nr:hypothetical protein [Gaiellaceae bacterium]